LTANQIVTRGATITAVTKYDISVMKNKPIIIPTHTAAIVIPMLILTGIRSSPITDTENRRSQTFAKNHLIFQIAKATTKQQSIIIKYVISSLFFC
jgi:hypothetical protein